MGRLFSLAPSFRALRALYGWVDLCMAKLSGRARFTEAMRVVKADQDELKDRFGQLELVLSELSLGNQDLVTQVLSDFKGASEKNADFYDALLRQLDGLDALTSGNAQELGKMRELSLGNEKLIAQVLSDIRGVFEQSSDLNNELLRQLDGLNTLTSDNVQEVGSVRELGLSNQNLITQVLSDFRGATVKNADCYGELLRQLHGLNALTSDNAQAVGSVRELSLGNENLITQVLSDLSRAAGQNSGFYHESLRQLDGLNTLTSKHVSELNRSLSRFSQLWWAEYLAYSSLSIADEGNLQNACCIINDTRHELGHVGCKLVMSNLFEVINNFGGQVVFSFESVWGMTPQLIREMMQRVGVVIINGEGTLHSDRSHHLYQIASIAKDLGKRVYLVNAVWQNNIKGRNMLGFFDGVFVREPKSHREIIKDGFPGAECIADMTFYSRLNEVEMEDVNEIAIERIVVVDSVIGSVSSGLSRLCDQIGIKLHCMSILKTSADLDKMSALGDLSIIKNASLIISGRFHAVALAINLGVPFVAIESNTYKISGLIEAVGLNPNKHLLAEPPADIAQVNAIIEGFDPEYLMEYRKLTRCYSEESAKKINSFFSRIF